jgi:GAF domain-containing protein
MMFAFVTGRTEGQPMSESARDADLKVASKTITQALMSRANVLESFTTVFKVTTLIGAFLIAVAKGADWPPSITYAAAGAVFVCAVLNLIADKGASISLASARLALDRAIEGEAAAENNKRKNDAAEQAYIAELERLSHFQAAREFFRAIFEDVITANGKLNEVDVIDRILKQARRALFMAHGFEMSDFYTICVYQRVVGENGRAELVCKANIRAIDCNLSQARSWPEGVGVAGAALAQRAEVVVPDLTAPELGSLYNLPLKNKEDDKRYRSIVAEPILGDSSDELWGILIATSSKPGHFSLEDRSYVNVTQSFAGMLGLAVKLVRAKAKQ